MSAKRIIPLNKNEIFNYMTYFKKENDRLKEENRQLKKEKAQLTEV